MQTTMIRRVVPIAAIALAGCGGNTMGALGDILGQAAGGPAGGQSGQVTVEVRGVDAQRQEIQVATQDGRTGSVRYDRNTVVVYREQQYPVTALERGDIVVMQLQDAQGTTYTARIDVQQSVRDRPGSGGGNVVQLAGRIAQIDHQRGTFVLQTQGGNVNVTLPYNPPQATLDYFHRLRVGTNIRLEATSAGSGRYEVYRFL